MEITVDTRDLQAMAARYAGAERIVADEMRRGVTRAVLAVEADAKRLAPVDRGQLRRSITHEVTAAGRDVVGKAGTNLEYARFVEEGRGPGRQPPVAPIAAWASRRGIPAEAAYLVARAIGRRGTRPKPYLRPAFEKNRGAITRELGPVLLRRVSERLGAS